MINNLRTPLSELQTNFDVLQIDAEISSTGENSLDYLEVGFCYRTLDQTRIKTNGPKHCFE